MVANLFGVGVKALADRAQHVPLGQDLGTGPFIVFDDRSADRAVGHFAGGLTQCVVRAHPEHYFRHSDTYAHPIPFLSL